MPRLSLQEEVSKWTWILYSINGEREKIHLYSTLPCNKYKYYCRTKIVEKYMNVQLDTFNGTQYFQFIWFEIKQHAYFSSFGPDFFSMHVKKAPKSQDDVCIDKVFVHI